MLLKELNAMHFMLAPIGYLGAVIRLDSIVKRVHTNTHILSQTDMNEEPFVLEGGSTKDHSTLEDPHFFS